MGTGVERLKDQGRSAVSCSLRHVQQLKINSHQLLKEQLRLGTRNIQHDV